jgi:hypothetical protein
VTVDQGKVVVSGSADSSGLELNGVRVPQNGAGDFKAVVDLNSLGGGGVLLSLVGDDQERIVVRLPVGLLREGVSLTGLLDDLVRAGTTIDLPQGGFVTLDGTMPVVSGRVLDADRLASLTVNGKEVISLLGPKGAFSVIAPSGSGSNREIVVTITDTRGVSQSSTFTTRRINSTIGTRAGLSVSAAGALGVRITNVRLDTSQLRTKRRLGVTLTVRDGRGLLIRGAAVRLRGYPGRYVVNGPQRVGFTSNVGVARFTLPLKRDAFRTPASRRFALGLRATTPRSAAERRVPVRLPTLAAR